MRSNQNKIKIKNQNEIRGKIKGPKYINAQFILKENKKSNLV